jgi:hypothetical protein
LQERRTPQRGVGERELRVVSKRHILTVEFEPSEKRTQSIYRAQQPMPFVVGSSIELGSSARSSRQQHHVAADLFFHPDLVADFVKTTLA